MKSSKYNIAVPINENISLVVNTFSGAYILLKSSIAQMLQSHDIASIAEAHEVQYNMLIKEGIIIDDDLDELASVENKKLLSRFDTRHYHLTINPTLNCNLDCWYCYESHIKQSQMTEDTVQKVLRHLETHHEITNYSYLTIAFFGGEPFLKPALIGEFTKEIKAFCDREKIKLDYSITTNGTLITKSILEKFKDVPVSFQITFDGDITRHDKVRHYVGSEKGSYNRIIESLKAISETLSDYHIIIRINYDLNTLKDIPKILNDIDFLPRKKVVLSLHKVWQVTEEVDKSLIYGFINEANDKKFIVDYHQLTDGVGGCYADRYNQCVINFNGDIYKCTARDFSKENREGILSHNGKITWKVNRLINRMALLSDKTCRECILYPACPGLCSQARLEGMSGEKSCQIPFDELNDILLLNYNQKVLGQEIERL